VSSTSSSLGGRADPLRRFDLLNAALSLDNDVEESKKKKRPRSTATRVKKKKKKAETSNAYHFIAFVPVGQSVWQLDGLEASPVHVGEKSPTYPTQRPLTHNRGF
jgi:hypothetical protein